VSDNAQNRSAELSPADHIDWFDDNVHWFENLPLTSLGVDVPNCPGWTVERVITHLAFGLGLAYPHAVRAPETADDDTVWNQVSWPASEPSGMAAIRAFAEHMDACVELFRATDPDRRCWTYDDSNRARFWFRRAAIETALHRLDVAEALGLRATIGNQKRLVDALDDAVRFALPLAIELTGEEPGGAVTIRPDGLDVSMTAGDGPAVAIISGDPTDLLAALWGRHIDQVTIDGEAAVARRWLGLVSAAFAGR
jgi:uncharacterized protein (TIGR03083 family)